VPEPEPETLAELIADCAAIPPSLRAEQARLPAPRAAAPWEVDDTCLAQVSGLDEFI
jgi:hypothetical protein